MKNTVKTRFLLTCMASAMSLSIYGCSLAQDPSDPQKTPDTVQLQGSDQTAQETPDLTGDIKEIQGKQLTVIENITETSEDGGDVMISPGDGEDSDFNKITVTYDKDTLFSIQAIYDGGERHEVTEATADDLDVGQLIEVWGTTQDGQLKATHIRIVQVILS